MPKWFLAVCPWRGPVCPWDSQGLKPPEIERGSSKKASRETPMFQAQLRRFVGSIEDQWRTHFTHQENPYENGKPYEQMDDLGVPLFLETPIFTLPETTILHLNIGGWEMIFLVSWKGWAIFSGAFAVSSRECHHLLLSWDILYYTTTSHHTLG